ncbi:MAG TPA: response regulator transcription factor [Terriglobales bacterium]|nr:response regulator transcription factor [Terriglobales bacterium]
MGRPRILLADDHTLLAHAFRKLLEPEFEVVGTAADGRKLLVMALELKPDLVLVDLGMPLLNGIDAGRELKKLLPETKLLVVTMNEDTAVAAEAIREWASGYLLKKSAGEELIFAIRSLLRGQSYVTPTVAQHIVEEFVREPEVHFRQSLTRRQREVLQLLAEGRTMKEAANILKLTIRTIAFHKYKIMKEFGLQNNSDLLKLAIREHLIPPA